MSTPLRLQLYPFPDTLDCVYRFKIAVSQTSARALEEPHRQLIDIIMFKTDSTGRELLDKAVASRDLDDIHSFFEYIILTNNLRPFSRETREIITSQIAHEWDIDAGAVRECIVASMEERAKGLGGKETEISAEQEEMERIVQTTESTRFEDPGRLK